MVAIVVYIPVFFKILSFLFCSWKKVKHRFLFSRDYPFKMCAVFDEELTGSGTSPMIRNELLSLCWKWLTLGGNKSFYCFQALSAGIQNRSPKPGPVTHEQELGYFLETGLQRAHVIHFKNGWVLHLCGCVYVLCSFEWSDLWINSKRSGSHWFIIYSALWDELHLLVSSEPQ